MINRIALCSCLALVACLPPSYVEPTKAEQQQQEGQTVGGTPVPTIDDPFKGLPALSGDGKSIALPTLTDAESGQERSVVFVSLGNAEKAGSSWRMPLPPPQTTIDQLAQRLRVLDYTSLPWVMTPDDPPVPMTITIEGTELYFAGDMKAQLALQIASADKVVGGDVFQVPAESETSPERIIAIGATVLWSKDQQLGYAYVRYDIYDGTTRDSEWRFVALDKKLTPKPPATGGSGSPGAP